MDPESAKASPTSHTYFSQRMRLHYLDWGNAGAPPMLLVHGNRDHCHNWDWVAQALRDEYHIIAPDFRGHGDSAWVYGAAYSHSEYVYDLAQLIHQQELAPVTIIAHSLGGSVALRYAGVYPENVEKMVVIEGTGGPPVEIEQRPVHERMREWIDHTRKASGRQPKRYDTLEDAYTRMHEANSHLREDQARHLTIHGSNQNEDGSYSWKFDNYTHSQPSSRLSANDMLELWQQVNCPALLMNARQGFEHRIGQDETASHFKHLTALNIDQAGHWLHHDQFDQFIQELKQFLANST